MVLKHTKVATSTLALLYNSISKHFGDSAQTHTHRRPRVSLSITSLKRRTPMQRVLNHAAWRLSRQPVTKLFSAASLPVPLRRLTSTPDRPSSKSPTSSSLPPSVTASLSSPTTSSPFETASEQDLDGGRVLGRLSKISAYMKHFLEHDETGQSQPPITYVELEQEVEEAYKIIQSALDSVGRPCSLEELGNRTKHDVVPFPPSALNYKDYLRATDLRDSLERSLEALNIMPPKESFLKDGDKPLDRLERRALRKQRQLEEFQQHFQQRQEQHTASAAVEAEDEPNRLAKGEDHDTEEVTEIEKLYEEKAQLRQHEERLRTVEHHDELPELRPVTEEELEKRKRYLEEMTSIRNVLKGYDTVLLQVGRVHKVIKEGTTMRMRALVAIGNGKGTAGYGEGKSETAQHAIERACRDAKRNLLHVSLFKDRTIYHRVKGKFVRAQVSLWPKPRGSGITGNNNYLAIFKLFGIKDVGAKQHGSRNLVNSVKALFNAISKLETPESICESRGISEIPRAPPLKRKANYRPL